MGETSIAAAGGRREVPSHRDRAGERGVRRDWGIPRSLAGWTACVPGGVASILSFGSLLDLRYSEPELVSDSPALSRMKSTPSRMTPAVGTSTRRGAGVAASGPGHDPGTTRSSYAPGGTRTRS